MLTALPPPPVIEQPAPYEASYGSVVGRAPAGTAWVVVRAGGRVLASRHLRGRRFSLRVDLPLRDVAVSVTAVRRDGKTSRSSVGPVFGLPRAASPRAVADRADPGLARALGRLVRGRRGTAAFYVQSLTTGHGAAANARARFPAASTLKLAVAVAALARTAGPPAPGSRLDVLLRQMLVRSDNEAANAVEVAFGGSTRGGSAIVNAVARAIGLRETEMYGGYETRTTQARIPLRADDQPRFSAGKATSAADLATLFRAVWLASAGRGPLRGQGVTPREARYLLWVLAHVRDPGKLSRQVEGRRDVAVLHKAGWIDDARHDAGLLVWRGGIAVAVVMTHDPAGVGRSADVLAGRVATAALARFRERSPG